VFSLYHVWSPWQFFSRLVAVAPYVHAVWRRRNVYLGVTVHVLLTTVGSLLLVGSIASRL
jgi:CAAX protease family protein